ncbi:MAG TPA: glycosyltransferase family 2 protein [Candidatus Nitrosocosmicus sp.]|jgi:GT2 family glycosyltransferase
MLISNTNRRVLLSIVTWNHAGTIKNTIDSIFKQTYKDLKVVIFDNKSEDETIDVIKRSEFIDHITLIQNESNIGFCGGHNEIIKNNKFDYIFLVNPDIILKEDYIEKALKAFNIDKKIGAVCGLLLQSFDENPKIDSTGMSLMKSRRFELINHGLKLGDIELSSGYVAGLDGALPAFKAEAVQDLLINGDLFNQLFFAHKEDWDISWRLILFGWKIYFYKESIAMHPRMFKPNNLRRRIFINNKIKFNAFKNQLLLLLINEDKVNFIKDSYIILFRLFVTTIFCILFEPKSLKAYNYVLQNWKKIFSFRKQVQKRRKVSNNCFRIFLNWKGIKEKAIECLYY